MRKLSSDEKKSKIREAALSLFASRGFYTTTIPDIAKSIKMSVGSFYNYFKSKDEIAKDIIIFISEYLGSHIKEINEKNISTEQKVHEIVDMYFTMAVEKPEMIDYFLRVYLSNREVFRNGCEGMICVTSFVTEMMIFFEEGAKCGDLRDQDFFSAFGLFLGYLGGMVFLKGENILEKDLDSYIDDISTNIYLALKTS